MTTLCYIEKDDSYLMMHRTVKKNDVNKDKWIGVGGHAELGESPEECLLREVKEETGYTLTSWRFRGLVTFVTEAENSKTVEYMEYMCLYTAGGFTGEPTACDEGELAWVKKEDILHLNLWEGDKIFFRLLNEDEPFFSLKLRYVGDTLAEAVLNGKQMELFEERSGDGTPIGTIVERGVGTVRDGVTERHISGLHGRMRRAAVRYCCRKGVPGKIRIRAATIFQAPAIFRRAIHIWKGLCGKSARSSASTQRQRS